MKNLFFPLLSIFLFACSAGADDPNCVRNNCLGTCIAKEEALHRPTPKFCRPQYVCYQDAECTTLDDGKCGWKETSQLKTCIADKTGPVITPTPAPSIGH